jgi:hypothetical protein
LDACHLVAPKGAGGLDQFAMIALRARAAASAMLFAMIPWC